MIPNARKPPKSNLSLGNLIDYGYSKNDMYPIDYKNAKNLFNTGYRINIVYPDNTTKQARHINEISKHIDYYGVDIVEWQNNIKQFAQLENNFIFSDKRQFAIYQLKDDESSRYYRFTNLSELKRFNLTVKPLKYNIKYIDDKFTQDDISRIFDKFNGDSPSDSFGRSLSVSDIIAFNSDTDLKAYYVDSFG